MDWQQLKTILWLRWRLTRNQWTRSRGVGAVITAFVAVAMLALAGFSFGGGFLGGLFGLRQSKPILVMAVWLAITVAFLFIWLISLINELQRSETIDLQRLMHLPVALGQMFLINFVASHLTLGIFLFVPGMIGLAAGLAISRTPSMVLLIPLSLSMVFMVSAWTYLLRGWLASLMANPRRRRAVIMGITFAFVMISQLPNLYFNVLARGDRRKASQTSSENTSASGTRNTREKEKWRQLLAFQKFVPPLWVSVGAGALAEGDLLPACLGTAGCLALGVLGLRRAYLSTVRFYHGETGKQAPARIKPNARPTGKPGKQTQFLTLRLPKVPEQATAVALATFRSMLRAPEVKMAWASSFFVTLILGASFLLRGAPKIPDLAKPFIATIAVVFPVFMLVQFFANQFGFDRDGFRSLVLSPAPRRHILLGKNLACLPVGAGFGLVMLTLVAIWAHLPLLVVLAALLRLATLLVLAGLVGNLLSLVAPYRIQPGSMKPTKMPGLAMLMMVACHLFFPIAMMPVFLPPVAELLWRNAGGLAAIPVDLCFSAVLLAIAGVIYWQTLGALGNLLQRRETKILSIVTVEID